MKRRDKQPVARPTSRTLVSSDADRELWQLVASRIEPLRKGKARVPDVEAPVMPTSAKPSPSPRSAHTSRPAARPVAAPPAPARVERPAASRPPPLPVGIDRRKTRRIAKGHIEIGARLDLHGMTQAAAERRLRAFLLDARAHGVATVLVITGKGGSGDAATRREDGSERGVLRRAVPMWLEAPQLRDSIVGYAAAHARHGGAGALYIHLRKPDRRPK